MNYMMFDGESFNLHGATFAIGYVVIDEDGNELENGIARLSDKTIELHISNLPDDWVAKNVVPVIKDVELKFDFTYELEDWFWHKWIEWKGKDTKLVSDVAWPVETNLLSRVVTLDIKNREWEGPYPLLDLASYLDALGIDPITTFERKDSELPAHNPLNDARQSARIFLAAKWKMDFALKFMEEGRKLRYCNHTLTMNEFETVRNIKELSSQYYSDLD